MDAAVDYDTTPSFIDGLRQLLTFDNFMILDDLAEQDGCPGGPCHHALLY